MAVSLIDQNKLGLYGLMAANLTVFYAAAQNNLILAGDWMDLARHLHSALPAGVGIGLTGIINAQLSPEAKARIVFMRWSNPLPGSAAFTRYAKLDPRVDLSSLERVTGSFPTDPREQNGLWYRLYKSVESDPAVAQAHRAFLFARDYTCLSLMMVIVLGVAGMLQIPSTETALGYLGILILQFVLAGQAARNHGKRLVTTVLALKSAGR